MATPWASSDAAVGARFCVPHQFAALSQGRYRPRLWVNRASFPRNEVTATLLGRATRIDQWTFFNKKIEAFKAQSNDGSTPSTPVKKATRGRKRVPKAKKGGPDEEPAAQVMGNQMPYQGALPTPRLMPLSEPLKDRSLSPLSKSPRTSLSLLLSSMYINRPCPLWVICRCWPQPWLPSQLLVALPIWTYLSILIYSSMSLCRCTQAHLTMGMQAQGHPARSGVTAYWGCLCRWSDEEEANETQASLLVS
ncbi:uncharacterized protein FMAN_00175 [Fusarium mangiferae]|uniref:Uncharacterized protein n=1 Tax=Fusarium mangiferae TaxID=192010 RepID=A0A1L7U0H7_FUSMA|nr:uncharacterized protein FMAN_00175 [Fusarium mangiferae]CVL02672.1 uncharacterized protein FMAN_00175 [Fusarium mangiferae]